MLLMVLIGSCATLAVATPITNLGIIEYDDNQDVILRREINSSQSINLTYVFSDIDKSALTIDDWWFKSTDNKTTYIFESEHIIVEWWFIPGIKYFIYQDENTNKLYSVGINYTNIDVPENPYEQEYQQLVENYNLSVNSYNMTNATLTNVTAQFNELKTNHSQKMQLLNITLKKQQQLYENLTDLGIAFTQLDDNYNQTYTLWESAVDNVTTYQTNYEGLFEEHKQLKKNHDDLAGAMPWYIIISIIGTALTVWILLRRKNIFGTPPPATDEITTGYGRIHAAIDKYILSQFRDDSGSDTTDNLDEIRDLEEQEKLLAEEKQIQKKTKVE